MSWMVTDLQKFCEDVVILCDRLTEKMEHSADRNAIFDLKSRANLHAIEAEEATVEATLEGISDQVGRL